jgi:hypothetical protein
MGLLSLKQDIIVTNEGDANTWTTCFLIILFVVGIVALAVKRRNDKALSTA